MQKGTRPPGGAAFEAVQVDPEGWLCLAPWIQTHDGYWWRPHIDGCARHGDLSRLWAEEMAKKLNAAISGGTENVAELPEGDRGGEAIAAREEVLKNGLAWVETVEHLKAGKRLTPNALCMGDGQPASKALYEAIEVYRDLVRRKLGGVA